MISDEELGKQITAFIAGNPGASRTVIIRENKTSQERCLRLAKAGLIIGFPPAMSSSAAGRIGGRKRHNGWKNFSLA